jgi:hypothetical protein
MDSEFNKVTDHAPNVILNTPAASEHVGEIERRIRVIKERCRSILCTLPYTRFLQIMLIHLLHHVVMWLNNFPVNMASLTVIALVRSYSVTSSILKTTAGPHSVHTVRFMRTILPLTARNRVAFLLFASVPRVIFKAPTVSLTSRRVLSLNAGGSLNYLPLTRSSNVWQHSLRRVMCLPIWFSQTGIEFLLTGLILTFPPLLTPPPWLCFPVFLQKCRGYFSHVMPRTLVLMMMNVMDSLTIPTKLTGPN